MEILQPVLARRQRWRIADLRAHEGGQLVALAAGSRSLRVLTPFDDIDPIRTVDRPRRVTPKTWRRALRSLVLGASPPGGLRTATAARIDLLPHQFEPALSILCGAATRLLLADDVGLGKTIQAALAIAELLARSAAERVLILTPAGVRDQWIDELRQRFGLHAVSGDAATLRAVAANIPFGLNPWSTLRIGVASIDYVKRPEVLPAVGAVRWDVVVVDEAHAAAGDSDRRQAASTLAERAAYVLLVTATPHSGDERAFADMCAIGSIDSRPDRLAIFRRRRDVVLGGLSRRIKTLLVHRSATERHMHAALERYRRAVETEHGDSALALAVLDKRALSSPWSLAQSVDRRLATLAGPSNGSLEQLALPLGDQDGETSDEDAPPIWPAALALANADEDRRLLSAVAAAARNAALHDDSKLRVLRRLLQRVGESVIVFTEYRDTARHLQAAIGGRALLLHGGLDRVERKRVLDVFGAAPGRVLVATDAAGQGLNLHRTCRFVVNVELPWNPVRLEQRIGRVDRIGQTGRVHAVHLVGRHTSEVNVLKRLKDRIERGQREIDAADPLGGFRVAAGSIGQPCDHVTPAALREAHRLAVLRGFSDKREANAGQSFDSGRPLLTRARHARTRAALRNRSIFIYRVSVEDEDGHLAEQTLASVAVDCGPVLTAARPSSEAIRPWTDSGAETSRLFWQARAARERAMCDLAARKPVMFQPGLFDRRSERAHAAQEALREVALRDALERAAAAERRARLRQPTVELALVIRP